VTGSAKSLLEHSGGDPLLFKEHLIYEQSVARTVRQP
jgi:hypothetical protein